MSKSKSQVNVNVIHQDEKIAMAPNFEISHLLPSVPSTEINTKQPNTYSSIYNLIKDYKMTQSKSQVNVKQENEKVNTALNFEITSIDTITPSTVSTRPPNTFKAPFFNFIRDYKKKHPNKHYSEIIRCGARRWYAMTQAEKAPYVLEAARNRQLYKPQTKKAGSKRSKTSVERSRSRHRRCPRCGNLKRPKKEIESDGSSIKSSSSSFSSH